VPGQLRSGKGLFSSKRKISKSADYIDQFNVLKDDNEHQRDEDRRLHERELDSLRSQRDEDRRCYEEELVSVRAANRKLEDSILELQHVSNEVDELKGIIKVSEKQPAIEKVVNVLSVELMNEIKKIPSWNQLGSRKIALEGQSREKQIKV